MQTPDKKFDPFQVFEVDHRSPLTLHVRVVRGYYITKGWVGDILDTPDPYVTLSVSTSPSDEHRTKTIDNSTHPEWNETFDFVIDSLAVDSELVVKLMDANYTKDDWLGTREIPIPKLPLESVWKKRVGFLQTSEIDLEMWTETNDDVVLRFSLALCDAEKQFATKRREHVFNAMNKFLGADAPRTPCEVPTIAVIGSGGGFRAMTAMSGVFTALVDSQIVDMVSILGGLSGSAWYISSLYSHKDWPDLTPAKFREELKDQISKSLIWLMSPDSCYRYINRIVEKRRQGQPVSFTDFFGMLIGETLLKGRTESRLSDQTEKLADASVPMPIYSCLHVKKSVSARIFHEWVEFTPFEIGMAKYGTFLKPEHFGDKLYMGHLVTHFPEPPLNFLQGIWGSAFCIQFSRLVNNKAEHKNGKSSNMSTTAYNRKPVQFTFSDAQENRRIIDTLNEDDEGEEESIKPLQASDMSDSNSDTESKSDISKASSVQQTLPPTEQVEADNEHGNIEAPPPSPDDHRGYWMWLMSKALKTCEFLNTRRGRAAKVFNFMRGLFLSQTFPFSPFVVPQDDQVEDTFEEIFEMYPTNKKKLYLADAGLSYNSPFPLVLRPQRGVDLILSFDFSARLTDDTPPFADLLLAERWARLNKVPFPPIDTKVIEREGRKECYVFRDQTDPSCPIIMHFVLDNLTFRKYKEPGVPRQSGEEREFADFSLFEDPSHPYSTFNFTYTNLAFDRLSQLTEFNTLLCKNLIIDTIKECVLKRQNHCKPLVHLKDVKRLSIKSKFKRKQLKTFLRSFSSDELPDYKS